MSKTKELFFYALTVLSVASVVDATQTCYKLNGDAAVSDFVPCNSFSGATSFCCGANRINTSATYTDDLCMTNGLCQSVVEVDGVEEYNYYRESCSSTDWPTSDCLRDVCTTPDENDTNGNAIMTPCDDDKYSNTWCCGKNNTDCCGTDDAITLAVTLGATSTATASSSTGSSIPSATSSSTTTSAASSTTTAAASSSSSSNSGLSMGASAGVGVGVAIGGLALIGAGLFWYVRRRRAARSQNSLDDHNLMGGAESADAAAKSPYYDHHQQPLGQPKPGELWDQPMELDSHHMAELDASGSKPGELPGNLPPQKYT